MNKSKKGLFAALKESLIKTNCCGAACTPAVKPRAGKIQNLHKQRTWANNNKKPQLNEAKMLPVAAFTLAL